MPVDFKIVASRGLTVVRMAGLVTIDEIQAATDAYVAHPDYKAGQKQLVDLSRITAFEKDYARFIMLQAAKAGRFTQSRTQTLCVYYAPTDTAWDLGLTFMRSWQDVDAVVPMIHRDEAESLALLGQPEKSIDGLLALTS